jgi:sterol 3beta-glucosyltransferase
VTSPLYTDIDRLVGVKEYDTHRKVTDPITGGAIAVLWTMTEFSSGIAKIFYKPVEGIIKTTVAIPRGTSLYLC